MPTGSVAPKSLRAIGMMMAAVVSALALALSGAPAHADPSQQDLENQINTKSQQFEKLAQQYDKAQQDLSNSKAQQASLQKQMAPMQSKVDAASTKVGQIASTAYRGGKVTALNAVLNASSANEVLDSLSTLDQYARSQNKDIDTFRSAMASFSAQKQKIDAVVAQQSKLTASLSSQKDTLQGQVNQLQQMRTQAYGTPSQTASNNYGPAPSIPGSAGTAVSYAWAQQGKPYHFGSDGPDSFDCSGLTKAAWRAAGYTLSGYVPDQWNETARISASQLQAGDLVFFYGQGHVGIYIGGGKVIHAPTEGEVVQQADMNTMPIDGYGRVH